MSTNNSKASDTPDRLPIHQGASVEEDGGEAVLSGESREYQPGHAAEHASDRKPEGEATSTKPRHQATGE
jgi:hypothetical protein